MLATSATLRVRLADADGYVLYLEDLEWVLPHLDMFVLGDVVGRRRQSQGKKFSDVR